MCSVASLAQVQLLPVPTRPSCTQLFKTGPCADSWRDYHLAVSQWNELYIERQQELAASQASAPLQQQIAALNKLTTDLKKLADDEHQQNTLMQQQMQADAATSLQASSAAHIQGLQQGAGIGVGASLVLFGLVYGIRRLMRGFTVTRKSQAGGMETGKRTVQVNVKMSSEDFSNLQRAANALWPDAILSNSGILLGLARLAAKDILKKKTGRRRINSPLN
jgi:hypothetical protein